MSTRIDRVAERVKEDLSGIIRKDVDDARIGFISITNVDMSPDLKNARVYISVLGTEQQKKDSMKGLNSATGFIRGKLGHLLELREVPTLSFVLDNSLEKGSRVLDLISKIGQEHEGNNRRPKKSRQRG